MSRETAMTQLLTINSSFVFIRGRLHLGSNSRQTTFPSLPSFSIISSCLQSIPTGHVECGRFFYKCKKSCYATVENGLYWQASSKCHSISLHTDLIDLLAILQKSLDRALFLYIFLSEVRSSGVRASITIVHIRKFYKM